MVLGLAGAEPVVALVVLVATLGPALTSLPLGVLRVVIGGLLLIFGLQWLRKAVLRSAGVKEMHDEQLAFREDPRPPGPMPRAPLIRRLRLHRLLQGGPARGTRGRLHRDQRRRQPAPVGLAAAAAAAAVVVVIGAGVAVRAPLARVPENTLKLLVGVMLTSFGMFWSTEGAGARWPGDEAALLAIIPGVLVCAWAMAAVLRHTLVAANGRADRISHLPHGALARPPGRDVTVPDESPGPCRKGLLAVRRR